MLFSESLLAGIYQGVTAKLHTGSSVIEAGSKIALLPSNGLQVETDIENTDVQGDTVVLEEAERGAVVEWNMRLLQEANASSNNTLVNKVRYNYSKTFIIWKSESSKNTKIKNSSPNYLLLLKFFLPLK